MTVRKGLGQANILRTNNNTSTGYGIVYADEVSGHRTVANLTALYALNDWQLSASGNNTDNDAIGQLWYVVDADGKGNGGLYRLQDWSKRKEAAGWQQFKPFNNTDETVNVTITSSVSSIKVSGVKINVFINNGKTPQTYTTNSEGKVSFVVNRGNYYQITFTEYGNAQPIAPVGFTAVLATRNVDVEYKPYDEESMENVVVTVTKYTDGTGAAYEGVPVVVTVDRKNTTYNADAKGQVSLYVPYGKEFTVNVENQDGYSVSLNRNTRTYTASVPQRLIDYKMYQFRAGIFIIDNNLNEYYLEEWQAAGKTAEEAVAIKVADANLTLNRGTFMIRISDMLAPTALPKKSWCTQELQFDSIALNGNNTKDANYYNGESSSFLVRQEAVERSLSVPAFDYAYEHVFSIAGHELHGFLMSVGQDYVHIANIGIIKQVLTALYGEEVATAYYNFVMKQRRWTSTQYRATYAWNYSSSAFNPNKSSSSYVLPVFAC